MLFYVFIDLVVGISFVVCVVFLCDIDVFVCDFDLCVVQVLVSIVILVQEVVILCLEGGLVIDICLMVCINVLVIVELNSCCESGNVGGGGCIVLDGLIVFDYWQVQVCEVLCIVLVNLCLVFVFVGVMDVVLGLGWLGILLYEVVGYGFEGDFNCKGYFVFVGLLGQCVVVFGVIVLDDGMILDWCGLILVDDEGNVLGCNVLIEDGILIGYMQDWQNVWLMGVELIGNGWCESYVYVLMLCMINIFMLVGLDDFVVILVDLWDGVYVVGFGGGQVDIISGKFVFFCIEVYCVKDGVLGDLVCGVMLIGDGVMVL